MNAQSVLPGLKACFDNDVSQFSSDDPVVQENRNLKAEHTRRAHRIGLD